MWHCNKKREIGRNNFLDKGTQSAETIIVSMCINFPAT